MSIASLSVDVRPAALTPRLDRAASWWPFALLLAGYLAAHFILRLTGSASLTFDEAEQFLLVQTLAPGYNTQPPLLTWCFWALSHVFGESVATLTLLRLGFLGLAYAFLYGSARLLLGDARRAWLVAGSLLLIPALAWEAVADRTHTTLLCALSLATLYVTLQILHDGRRRWFVLLGVCAGLGILCKYNYALFAAALLLATLSMPGYRRRFFTRQLTWTAVTALLLVAPHGAWLAEHYEELLALIRAKALVGESGPVMARLRGLLMIGNNFVQLVGALLAVLVVCFPQVCRPKTWSGGEPRRWLDRMLLVALLLLAAIVLIEGTAHIRIYWMLPLLTIVPLTFFLRIEQKTLQGWQWRWFATAVVLSVAAVGVMRVQQAQHHAPRDALYAALAERLQTDGFTGGIVWAENHQEGGNLRLLAPAARVQCRVYPLLTLPDAEGPPRLLLWDASLADGVSGHLWLLAKARGIRLPRDRSMVRYVESPMAATGEGRVRLGYWLLQE